VVSSISSTTLLQEGLVSGRPGKRYGDNDLLMGIGGELEIIAWCVTSVGLTHDPALRIGGACPCIGALFLRSDLFEFVKGMREVFLPFPDSSLPGLLYPGSYFFFRCLLHGTHLGFCLTQVLTKRFVSPPAEAFILVPSCMTSQVLPRQAWQGLPQRAYGGNRDGRSLKVVDRTHAGEPLIGGIVCRQSLYLPGRAYSLGI